MSTIAVIPARGGSKRLRMKNIYPVFGKPMLAWSIEACRRSSLIEEVLVSTDHDEIAAVGEQYGAEIIPRDASLADDATPKMDVIRHAYQWYLDAKGQKPKVVVSVQANSPELRHQDMDQGISLLQEHGLWEVISVGADHVQNASFRVIDPVCLYNRFLSAHMGVVINECTDVHTQQDVADIEARYANIENMLEAIGARSHPAR